MSNLYEDPLITISLSPDPVAAGHLIVRPQKKVKYLQDLDDKEVEHLFFGASYAATALFELANAQGTNIICNEEEVEIHVIARAPDDGLDFMWQPTQGNPQELQGVAKSIQDKLDIEQWKKDNPDSGKPAAQETQVIEENEDKGDDAPPNFLIRSMDRTP